MVVVKLETLQKQQYLDLGRSTHSDKVLMWAAKRYFGGTDVPAVLQTAKNVGTPVILDLLGEGGNSSGGLQERIDRTKALGDIVRAEGINASIAVRLGQFGDDASKMLEVVDHLTGQKIFTWIDMEKRAVVDRTILAYRKAALAHPGQIGLAIQAYLNRTRKDIEDLISFSQDTGIDVHLRPVRGVYVKEADMNLRMMHRNLVAIQCELARCGVTTIFEHIGSHSPQQIAKAVQLKQEHGKRVESVQWLWGVYKPDGKMAEALNGVPGLPKDFLEWYIPFGPSAAAYLKRRLEEAGTVFGMALMRFRESGNAKKFRELLESPE